ncbi:MAG: patatin-like phospholipase family protein [Butyrivibrio sp.]
MNIGLVLSGGMAKGAYQVGALQAISEVFPKGSISYVSASSIGVLNSYGFLTGRLEQLADTWRNIEYDGTRALIGSMLKSTYLQQSIKDICKPEDKIDETFYITLMNLKRRIVDYQNLHHVDSSLLPKYLKASVAMPLYNRPVMIGGENYYDGAVIDNIPIYPLMKHKIDYIICIYFDEYGYIFENEYFDNKILKLTYSNNKVITDSLTFSRGAIDNMIVSGYEKTAGILREVFANGIEDYEYIYHMIEERNRGAERKIRITGDLAVTNINKVTQKLAKRKIKF